MAKHWQETMFPQQCFLVCPGLKPFFTLLKIWNFRALFSKQWTALGLGNRSVQ
jgi:hypothetical protein